MFLVLIETPIYQILTLALVVFFYLIVSGRGFAITSDLLSRNTTNYSASLFNNTIRIHESNSQNGMILFVLIGGVSGAIGLGWLELLISHRMNEIYQGQWWLILLYLFCKILMPLVGLIAGAVIGANLILPLMTLICSIFAFGVVFGVFAFVIWLICIVFMKYA